MLLFFGQFRLFVACLLLCTHPVVASYKGSHAYNHSKAFKVEVNTATGTLSLSYPLIKAQGVRMPLTVNLIYSFNARGMFGLPAGWQLDLDHITQHTAELGGMQWLIDNLWHDETGFASGLKYYNQHGTRFQDKGQSQPIPDYPNLNHRHVAQHKDGSRHFFSHQGLLMLHVDRFDNHVQFSYEEPVSGFEFAKLASIKDDYGNVYRFSYEPGTMIIHSPDHRVQKVYFNEKGVTRIENSLQQKYTITYVNKFGRNLVRTMETPEGLINELGYDGIFYTDDSGKKQMPVVGYFKQYDRSDLKTHHEVYYKFSAENNYTGYPKYALSNRGDSLIDSNDQLYKYNVEVTRVNAEQQNQLVYEYNYLHLPVAVRALRQGQPYLKTTYDYAISPFKYSRSTNYDKPTEVIRYIWNGSTYVPSDKTTTTYDRYGNKLNQTRSVYDRQNQQWKMLEVSASRYFTDNYSLLAEHTHVDLLGGRAIRKSYGLAADGKTHSYERQAWKHHQQKWQDWQQTDLTHDEKGRQRSATLRWLMKNQPGVQSITHHTRYQFDPATAELTITKVSGEGREHTSVMDTRNARRLKTITPKGEVNTYTYDALNRLLTHTDPAGYVTRKTYETFSTDGQNTVTVQSPLGNTRRMIHDASNRSISQQDLHKGKWRTLSSHSYDAFGKVNSATNILGLTTIFAYDEQGRRTKTTDPWGNEHTIHYNDPAMTTTARINGRQHKVVSKVPWERKRIIQNYPVTNNTHDQATEFVETTVVRDAHKKMISTTSALVDLHTQNKRESVTSYLRYDPQHNLITSDTHTWDGLHGQKNRQYDLLNHLYSWDKTLKTPENISRHEGYRYLYDSDGLLTTIESPKTANGNRLYLHHRYDKNGREIEKTLQNGHHIHYQYDNRGLLTQHAWNRNQQRHTVSRQYDADGRLTQLSDSDGQTMHYRYTPNGRLLQLRYPDNRSISYTLDDYDRVITQKDANQTEQHFVYNPEDKGRLSSLKVNGSRIDFHYGKDDNGYLGSLIKRTTTAEATGNTTTHFRYGVFRQMVESTSSNPKAQYGVSYVYNPRGELLTQVQKLSTKGQPPQQHTTEYRYDGLQRLTDEVHSDPAGNFQKRYRYDGNSNLLAEEDHSNCGPGQSLQYSYNNLDQLVSIKMGEVLKPVLHDINGHLTQDHQATLYNYDDAGFLLQVQPQKRPATRYEYLPNGLLSRRNSGDSQSRFYPDHHRNMQSVVKDGQWRSLVRHGTSIVGRQTEQGLDQFFKVNESTGVVLQQAKGETLLHLHRYDAYGKPLQHNPTDDTDFTWNQELTEPETGLTYLRHRFHHPQLRRFITRDSKAVDNRYAYTHGDPVNYIDPTGHNEIVRYVTGALMFVGGLAGALLAAPTMGASLAPSLDAISAGTFSLTAITAGTSAGEIAQGVLPVAAGLATGISGESLIASQVALSKGNKTASKILDIFSIVMEGIAVIEVVAMAPAMITGFRNIPSFFDSAASKLTKLETEAGAGVMAGASKVVTAEEVVTVQEGYLPNLADPPPPQKLLDEAMNKLKNRMENDFAKFSKEQKSLIYRMSRTLIYNSHRYTSMQPTEYLDVLELSQAFSVKEMQNLVGMAGSFNYPDLNINGDLAVLILNEYADQLETGLLAEYKLFEPDRTL